MKNKILLLLIAVLCLSLMGANSMSAAGVEDEVQRIFNQEFKVNVNPLEVTIVKYPEYQNNGDQEVLLICRVKNHSALIEEVIYSLQSDYGLGGIKAVIDYDGPFGPKLPEPYNWHKVPVYPGEEEYLYITFPVPSIYAKELLFNLAVDRWLGPRG
ncbi:MAG: hypothetical protein A2Z68_01375 [Candidatus Nealsonbacteria bacterium RBG_13_38_11]|uniref:DUF4352 domain-containing protein n=1 Tax=Candidatus Nealsonbacteria bacterium RBG_13_38_11 TaxID=1801662 RepID=A0A1G2E108_9BACT|nr:MAG: hypothetical protein A2Z68_01375 [Candidatus Nealsonbacteria bacterium RBG_13_38_11]